MVGPTALEQKDPGSLVVGPTALEQKDPGSLVVGPFHFQSTFFFRYTCY